MLERISMEFSTCFCHVDSFGRHKIRRNRTRWLDERSANFSLAQCDNDRNIAAWRWRFVECIVFFCLVVCTSRASRAGIIFPFHGKDIINDIASAPRYNDTHTQKAERWALSVVCFLHTMWQQPNARHTTSAATISTLCAFKHLILFSFSSADRTNESVNVQTKLKIYIYKNGEQINCNRKHRIILNEKTIVATLHTPSWWLAGRTMPGEPCADAVTTKINK